MIYYFGDEIVPEEKWKWVATYKDGSVLRQFDNGVFHQLREVDADNLSAWSITDGTHTISVDMTEDMTPVHFYRRNVSHEVGSDSKTVSTIYGFGYQTEEDQYLYMVHDNDDVYFINKDNTILDSGKIEKFSS